MVNYSLLYGGLNPVDEFQKGLKQGNAYLRQDALDAQNRAILEQEMRMKEMQQQNALQMQNDMFELSELKNPDISDYRKIVTKYPSLATNYEKTIEGLDLEKKQKRVAEIGEIYSLLQNDREDLAIDTLERKKQIVKKQRSEAEYLAFESMIDLIKNDPTSVKNSLGLQLSTIMDEDKFTKLMSARRGDALLPAEMDYKLAGAQKFLAETRKALVEAEKIENDMTRANNGFISAENKTKFESDLRKEIEPILRKNRQAKQAYEQMQSIFQTPGKVPGIQDVAAVVSFFKSIDPNSTVTTTETGQIQGATGLQGKIASIFNKATSQGNFTQEAREQLIKTAGEIYKPLQREAQNVYNNYEKIAERQGLNFDNIKMFDFKENQSSDNQIDRPANNASIEEIKNFYLNTPKKKVNNTPQVAGNKNEPRGIRNNNPLNIEFNENNKWQGQSGSDGRFSKFKSPEYGLRAGFKLLDTYQKRGQNTIRKIFNTYAPPNENNTKNYINFVAKNLGISPDQEINIKNKKQSKELLKAIVKMENGKNVYKDNQFDKAFNLAFG